MFRVMLISEFALTLFGVKLKRMLTEQKAEAVKTTTTFLRTVIFPEKRTLQCEIKRTKSISEVLILIHY